MCNNSITYNVKKAQHCYLAIHLYIYERVSKIYAYFFSVTKVSQVNFITFETTE